MTGLPTRFFLNVFSQPRPSPVGPAAQGDVALAARAAFDSLDRALGARDWGQVAQVEAEFARFVGARLAGTGAEQRVAQLETLSDDALVSALRGAVEAFSQALPGEWWPVMSVAGNDSLDPDRWIASLGVLPAFDGAAAGDARYTDESLRFFSTLLGERYYRVRVPPSRRVLRSFSRALRRMEASSGDGLRVLDAGGMVFAPVPMAVSERRALSLAECARRMQVERLQGRGQGSVVAVLDTGLDVQHPAFREGLESGRIEYDHRGMGSRDDGDPSGHGTHVASIVAGADPQGANRGIAPDARLVAIRVFDPARALARDRDIIDGLRHAVARGAHIVNLSLGAPGPADRELSDVCSKLVEKDICLVLAAAGNANRPGAEPGGVESPANGRWVTAVAALDGDDRIAPFSSRGKPGTTDQEWGKPDLAAYGVSVVAAGSSGSGAGATWVAKSGTSMATPCAAGFAAVLRGHLAHDGGAPPTPSALREVLLGRACSRAGLVDDAGAAYPDRGFSGDVGRGVPRGRGIAGAAVEPSKPRPVVARKGMAGWEVLRAVETMWDAEQLIQAAVPGSVLLPQVSPRLVFAEILRVPVRVRKRGLGSRSRAGDVLWDAATGELVTRLFADTLERTRGVFAVLAAGSDAMQMLGLAPSRKVPLGDLVERTGGDSGRVRRALARLEALQLVQVRGETVAFESLPRDVLEVFAHLDEDLAVSRSPALVEARSVPALIERRVTETAAWHATRLLFGQQVELRAEGDASPPLFYPYWSALIEQEGRRRQVFLDAVVGRVDLDVMAQ